MSRTSPGEIEYRLAELEHLLDGGVWPPTACARVGWTVIAAEKATRRHQHPALEQIRPFYAEARRAA